MRFSLFCGITKPKLRKIGRKCKCAYILPRGSGRGAAEVRKRGGKAGPQPAVPAVCDGGSQPAERPHEATAKLRASAAPRLRPARLYKSRYSPSSVRLNYTVTQWSQPAEWPHEASASCEPPRPGGCGPRGLKSRKSSPQNHQPGRRRVRAAQQSRKSAHTEPPIVKIGRNSLNDIVTVLRPNAITSSARGLRPHGLFLASFWLSLLPVVLRRESWQTRQRKKLTSRKNGRKRLPAKFSTG